MCVSAFTVVFLSTHSSRHRGPVCLCPHPHPHTLLGTESKKTLTTPTRAYKGAPSSLYTCFCTIMSLAIPDAQAPWLDKPLDIGGAPAMVDFAYADFMLTTINLTNTSLFSSVATPQHACLVPIYQASSTLACRFSKMGGGGSLLFYSPNKQPRTSFAPSMNKNPTHYGGRETMISNIFLFFHQPLVTGTLQIGEICPMASE